MKFPQLFQLVILAALPLAIWAQEKPKLGLVLSGGGAKGIAHIGVLKAMEDAGLRPDYIAGTSMGAVIGSLYALGYSADQIAEKVLELNWDEILSNEVPLNYIAFEEKEYYNRYLLDFPIYKGQIALSSGLIKGQMLTEVLLHNLWPSFQYAHFDSLPIPFRCLATDAKTGELIVFENGSLPTAVRASMALPTLFSAVDLDTTLAVDGGVLDNFPVDVVKEMGADYIIGVNVSAPSSEVPQSMVGILLNLATIPSALKFPEQKEKCDIYLEPDMMGYTTTSFGAPVEILDLGMNFGRAHLDELKALAREMGMAREPFTVPPFDSKIRIENIVVNGNELFSDVLIKNKLGIESGDHIYQGDLEEAIRRVYGINGFRKVDYSLEMFSDSVANLRLTLYERLPDHLYLSVHADNIFSAGIVVNYTARNLLGKDSRSIFALDISKNPRFRFDYYKYTGVNKRLAFNFRYDYLSEQLPTYEDGDPEDILINRVNRVAMNMITTQSLKSSYSLGGFYQNTGSRSRFGIIAPESIKKGVTENFGIRFTRLKNSLNNRNFPTRGLESDLIIDNILWTSTRIELQDGLDTVRLSTEGGEIPIPKSLLDSIIDAGNPGVYLSLYYNVRRIFHIGSKFQVIPRATIGLTFSWDEPGALLKEFTLGGWQKVWRDDSPVLGIHYAEIDSPNFGVAGVKFQHVFFKNFFFKYGADLLGYEGHIPANDISVNFDLESFLDNNLLLGYGAELTWRTRLGPISGGISSNTTDGNLRYYFSFGFSFNYSD